MIAFDRPIDEVGQIIAALEEDNLLENTIVFFWTDHGLRLPRHKQWALRRRDPCPRW